MQIGAGRCRAGLTEAVHTSVVDFTLDSARVSIVQACDDGCVIKLCLRLGLRPLRCDVGGYVARRVRVLCPLGRGLCGGQVRGRGGASAQSRLNACRR
eukprot:5427731-Pleurochrysis_carterae.AAC.2